MTWYDSELWLSSLEFDQDLAAMLRRFIDRPASLDSIERHFLDEAWLYRQIGTSEGELAEALRGAGFEDSHFSIDPFALAVQIMLGEARLPEIESAHAATSDWFKTRHDAVEALRAEMNWDDVCEREADLARRRAAFAIETATEEGWLEGTTDGAYMVTEQGVADIPFIDYAR